MSAPIYKMLKEYKASDPLPFHMPGHILGKGLMEELKSAGVLDITEIPGSDCLHHPIGVIKEAQELAAHCFGAGFTLFLVNGSTSGNHAMIQSVVKPGGKLIIGRDCHSSVLNALALINAEPIFVLPQMDDDNHIPLGVTADDVEKALLTNPDAQGILVTRPNYYGIAQPLEEIVKAAERCRIPLMVDEAHGAHFRFHDRFPKTAMELGADLCVQSLHKTLPTLTQTALLHGKEGGLINRKQVEMVASMLQTTSPSYILMASIDSARDRMEDEGSKLYSTLWQNGVEFDGKLSKTTCIERVARQYKGLETDFSRIVLSFKNTSLSGFQAEELLRKNNGIIAEMADLKHVVLIATPFHTHEDFEKLFIALETLSKEYGRQSLKTQSKLSWPLMIPERVLSLRDSLFSKKREVPINESEGAISAASVIPYPPGIPLLNPGEKITAVFLDYIRVLLSEKCPVHGVNQGKIQIIDNK